jgi:hypothetical protein
VFLSLEEIAQSQPPLAAATIRQAVHAAVDAHVFSGRGLNQPRVPPAVVCEDHPWLEWPHHQCLAPGMLVSERDTLHEIASLMSDSDREAFRRLLFAVRAHDEARTQAAALRNLEIMCPIPPVSPS